MFEFAAPLGGVGEISIVADGEFAFAAINYDWLRVHQAGVTGGGIARVADSRIAGKSGEALGIENICDEAEAFCDMKIISVRGTNSGGFLSAMLLSVKAEVGKFRGFRMRENAEHSTVIVEVVVVELEVLRHVF
jgi:hypothetical protein